MQDLPHTRSCFVCGERNPIGLKLRARTDGRVVRATFTPGAEHIGFQETIHGGLLSTLADELMVWACAVQTRRFAYCAELNVRFTRPARPGDTLEISAELVTNRKNRIFEAAASIQNQAGEQLVSATGKYMPLPPEHLSGNLGDFIGNPAEWLDLPSA